MTLKRRFWEGESEHNFASSKIELVCLCISILVLLRAILGLVFLYLQGNCCTNRGVAYSNTEEYTWPMLCYMDLCMSLYVHIPLGNRTPLQMLLKFHISCDATV